jgi:hypothetical protein
MNRKTLRDALAAYLQKHPNTWFDGQKQLGRIAGRYAWRTRVSDCRLRLGMNIVNRQSRAGKRVVSEYAYLP